MRKLRQLQSELLGLENKESEDLTERLWQLICYSPKMGPRPPQQQLLSEAKRFSLQVNDPHFSKSVLNFNGFIWGEGSRTVLITHGWGSKAIDFDEFIDALKVIDGIRIIVFDAPGNASSEGSLSNLMLFVAAVKEIVKTYGTPDVMLGHSLGAMANIVAINEAGIKPELLISIAPLIRLKENFMATMDTVEIPASAQVKFFESFEVVFQMPISRFNLNDLYRHQSVARHWLAFDREDPIAPYSYLKEFLDANPGIESKEYPGLGHERIVKDARIVGDVAGLIKGVING